jgi:hypothetical protein
MIFDRALQGAAAAALARALNEEGARTRSGGAWTRRRIQDTLANPVYAGLLVRWRGSEREQRRPARHPAIVSLQEFEAVAAQTRRRDLSAAGRATGGRPSRRFLLAGLARCGRCGGRMYSLTSTYKRKDGTHARKYQCALLTDGTGLCAAPPLDAVAVDALVLERLPRFMTAAERWLRELGSDRRWILGTRGVSRAGRTGSNSHSDTAAGPPARRRMEARCAGAAASYRRWDGSASPTSREDLRCELLAMEQGGADAQPRATPGHVAPRRQA